MKAHIAEISKCSTIPCLDGWNSVRMETSDFGGNFLCYIVVCSCKYGWCTESISGNS